MSPVSIQPPRPGESPGSDEPSPSFVAAVASVRRYLRFLGCPESAVADLVQDTLLAGLARWPAFAPPVPWLLATARNLFRRQLRRQRARRELLDLERLDHAWTEQALDGTGDAVSAALRECLAGLPARSRTALELRYGEGLERDVIAARVGLSAEGVKSLLARTRDALAECVRRRTNDG